MKLRFIFNSSKMLLFHLPLGDAHCNILFATLFSACCKLRVITLFCH
uniref:Uncharacterized protein n=1 Tax=Arundo donax TaxID=35708 RepID=A0A0A8ZXY6_ARUDO